MRPKAAKRRATASFTSRLIRTVRAELAPNFGEHTERSRTCHHEAQLRYHDHPAGYSSHGGTARSETDELKYQAEALEQVLRRLHTTHPTRPGELRPASAPGNTLRSHCHRTYSRAVHSKNTARSLGLA